MHVHIYLYGTHTRTAHVNNPYGMTGGVTNVSYLLFTSIRTHQRCSIINNY